MIANREKGPERQTPLVFKWPVRMVFEWVDLAARLDEYLASRGERATQDLRKRLDDMQNQLLNGLFDQVRMQDIRPVKRAEPSQPGHESSRETEGASDGAKPEVSSRTAADEDDEDWLPKLKAYVQDQKEKQAADLRDYPLHDLETFHPDQNYSVKTTGDEGSHEQ